jgi:hypothetical protein
MESGPITWPKKWVMPQSWNSTVITRPPRAGPPQKPFSGVNCTRPDDCWWRPNSPWPLSRAVAASPANAFSAWPFAPPKHARRANSAGKGRPLIRKNNSQSLFLAWFINLLCPSKARDRFQPRRVAVVPLGRPHQSHVPVHKAVVALEFPVARQGPAPIRIVRGTG